MKNTSRPPVSLFMAAAALVAVVVSLLLVCCACPAVAARETVLVAVDQSFPELLEWPSDINIKPDTTYVYQRVSAPAGFSVSTMQQGFTMPDGVAIILRESNVSNVHVPGSFARFTELHIVENTLQSIFIPQGSNFGASCVFNFSFNEFHVPATGNLSSGAIALLEILAYYRELPSPAIYINNNFFFRSAAPGASSPHSFRAPAIAMGLSKEPHSNNRGPALLEIRDNIVDFQVFHRLSAVTQQGKYSRLCMWENLKSPMWFCTWGSIILNPQTWPAPAATGNKAVLSVNISGNNISARGIGISGIVWTMEHFNSGAAAGALVNIDHNTIRLVTPAVAAAAAAETEDPASVLPADDSTHYVTKLLGGVLIVYDHVRYRSSTADMKLGPFEVLSISNNDIFVDTSPFRHLVQTAWGLGVQYDGWDGACEVGDRDSFLVSGNTMVVLGLRDTRGIMFDTDKSPLCTRRMLIVDNSIRAFGVSFVYGVGFGVGEMRNVQELRISSNRFESLPCPESFFELSASLSEPLSESTCRCMQIMGVSIEAPTYHRVGRRQFSPTMDMQWYNISSIIVSNNTVVVLNGFDDFVYGLFMTLECAEAIGSLACSRNEISGHITITGAGDKGMLKLSGVSGIRISAYPAGNISGGFFITDNKVHTEVSLRVADKVSVHCVGINFLLLSSLFSDNVFWPRQKDNVSFLDRSANVRGIFVENNAVSVASGTNAHFRSSVACVALQTGRFLAFWGTLAIEGTTCSISSVPVCPGFFGCSGFIIGLSNKSYLGDVRFERNVLNLSGVSRPHPNDAFSDWTPGKTSLLTQPRVWALLRLSGMLFSLTEYEIDRDDNFITDAGPTVDAFISYPQSNDIQRILYRNNSFLGLEESLIRSSSRSSNGNDDEKPPQGFEHLSFRVCGRLRVQAVVIEGNTLRLPSTAAALPARAPTVTRPLPIYSALVSVATQFGGSLHHEGGLDVGLCMVCTTQMLEISRRLVMANNTVVSSQMAVPLFLVLDPIGQYRQHPHPQKYPLDKRFVSIGAPLTVPADMQQQQQQQQQGQQTVSSFLEDPRWSGFPYFLADFKAVWGARPEWFCNLTAELELEVEEAVSGQLRQLLGETAAAENVKTGFSSINNSVETNDVATAALDGGSFHAIATIFSFGAGLVNLSLAGSFASVGDRFLLSTAAASSGVRTPQLLRWQQKQSSEPPAAGENQVIGLPQRVLIEKTIFSVSCVPPHPSSSSSSFECGRLADTTVNKEPSSLRAAATFLWPDPSASGADDELAAILHPPHRQGATQATVARSHLTFRRRRRQQQQGDGAVFAALPMPWLLTGPPSGAAAAATGEIKNILTAPSLTISNCTISFEEEGEQEQFSTPPFLSGQDTIIGIPITATIKSSELILKFPSDSVTASSSPTPIVSLAEAPEILTTSEEDAAAPTREQLLKRIQNGRDFVFEATKIDAPSFESAAPLRFVSSSSSSSSLIDWKAQSMYSKIHCLALNGDQVRLSSPIFSSLQGLVRRDGGGFFVGCPGTSTVSLPRTASVVPQCGDFFLRHVGPALDMEEVLKQQGSSSSSRGGGENNNNNNGKLIISATFALVQSRAADTPAPVAARGGGGGRIVPVDGLPLLPGEQQSVAWTIFRAGFTNLTVGSDIRANVEILRAHIRSESLLRVVFAAPGEVDSGEGRTLRFELAPHLFACVPNNESNSLRDGSDGWWHGVLRIAGNANKNLLDPDLNSAASTAGNIGVAFSMLLMTPTLATGLSRAGSTLHFSRCDFSWTEQLPFVENLLGLKIGRPWGSYRRGSVVSAVVVILTICSLLLLIAAVRVRTSQKAHAEFLLAHGNEMVDLEKKIAQLQRMKSAPAAEEEEEEEEEEERLLLRRLKVLRRKEKKEAPIPLLKALQLSHLPSTIFVPFLIMSGGTLSSSVAFLVAADSSWSDRYIFGLLTTLLHFAWFGWTAHVVFQQLPRRVVFEELPKESRRFWGEPDTVLATAGDAARSTRLIFSSCPQCRPRLQALKEQRKASAAAAAGTGEHSRPLLIRRSWLYFAKYACVWLKGDYGNWVDRKMDSKKKQQKTKMGADEANHALQQQEATNVAAPQQHHNEKEEGLHDRLFLPRTGDLFVQCRVPWYLVVVELGIMYGIALCSGIQAAMLASNGSASCDLLSTIVAMLNLVPLVLVIALWPYADRVGNVSTLVVSAIIVLMSFSLALASVFYLPGLHLVLNALHALMGFLGLLKSGFDVATVAFTFKSWALLPAYFLLHVLFHKGGILSRLPGLCIQLRDKGLEWWERKSKAAGREGDRRVFVEDGGGTENDFVDVELLDRSRSLSSTVLRAAAAGGGGEEEEDHMMMEMHRQPAEIRPRLSRSRCWNLGEFDGEIAPRRSTGSRSSSSAAAATVSAVVSPHSPQPHRRSLRRAF